LESPTPGGPCSCTTTTMIKDCLFVLQTNWTLTFQVKDYQWQD
jgi:hypothetical protein